MKHYLLLYLILFCISIIVPKNISAQVTIVDSTSNQKSLNKALDFFDVAMGDQLPLYNGLEYNFYPPIYKGNAYFQEINSFTPGAVFYDGLYFRDVPMLYDVCVDKVAVLSYNNFSKISLISERVKSFDLLGHHFVNIQTDTTESNSVIKPGFYDEIYGGKLEVLVRTEKHIQNEPSTTSTYQSYFNTIKNFFLKKNNLYYKVGSEGLFLSVLKDKKSELQQYIKTNKIKFRKNPKEAMVKIASYYDHLTN